jgi:hypothetical protein
MVECNDSNTNDDDDDDTIKSRLSKSACFAGPENANFKAQRRSRATAGF